MTMPSGVTIRRCCLPFVLSLALAACTREEVLAPENPVPPTTPTSDVELEIASSLRDYFAFLDRNALTLASSGEEFEARTLEFVARRYGATSEAYDAAVAAVERQREGIAPLTHADAVHEIASPRLRRLAEEVDAHIEAATSLDELRNWLVERRLGLASEAMDLSDGATARAYLLALVVIIDSFGDSEFWGWNVLGRRAFVLAKCLLGIGGGTMVGGLSGAAVGSSVPVIGTLAGGLFGGLGGALTGAAAHCF